MIQATTIRWFALMAAIAISAMLAIFGNAFLATQSQAIVLAGQAAATTTPKPISNGYPSVSPDGSHIAFTSNRGGAEDLFVISADGTGERQLTHTPEEEVGLQWTPDGKGVVFSVLANDRSRLYAISLDGKNQREIGSVPGRTPMLSPDGKRLVYMAGTWTATRLMVSALDGSNVRQINDGISIAWNNHWSPDGRRIAFTGKNESGEGVAVFIMNADGSQRRQVTHTASTDGSAQWPVWSSDGRQLAIQVSNLKAHNAHIWIVDLWSGEARKLAAHDQPYLDETPSWFPDGKRIAFQSNRTGKMEVWVMNAEGKGQRQVTRPAAQASAPANDTDPISGEWNVSFFVHDSPTPATFTFKLAGSKVTGTAYSEHTGAGTIRDGKWADGKLSFTLDFEKHESIEVTGTLKDGKLAGEFHTEGFTDKWEAKKKAS